MSLAGKVAGVGSSVGSFVAGGAQIPGRASFVVVDEARLRAEGGLIEREDREPDAAALRKGELELPVSVLGHLSR
jgi:hypothetical protein